MTTPQSSLDALARLAGDLASAWPGYQAVEADLAAPAIAAANLEPGHGADISRPTETVALARLEPDSLAYYDTVDNIAIAMHHIRLAQRRMTYVVKHHAGLATRLATEARLARCDGEHDPTCTNNAVRNGKCWRCIKALQRARLAEGA